MTKVVIPVAGLGSRFLPATKALPKELLPIIDKPIIHFIVEEAVKAGIETVVFITARPKVMIEDYFDPGDLVAHKLHEAGKDKEIEEVIELSNKIDIISLRQYEARGLGHAILQATPVVAGQSFAVLLGDDIIVAKNGQSVIGQCIQQFETRDCGSVVGLLEVPREETQRYGIAAFDDDGKIESFVEKPSPSEAPSNWALPGRYVFEDQILDVLRETKPGKGGEIQLTDAMDQLLKSSPFYAQKIDGRRFDTGSKLGYIMANVSFALNSKVYGEDFRAWLKNELLNH